MARTNPMLGPGAFDRSGEPHCCCKHTTAVMQYEGLGLDCLITAVFPLYACVCWTPTLRRHGDQIPGAENPCFCSKGFLDRDRPPHVMTKFCLAPLATCEYDGCCSLAHIITTVFPGIGQLYSLCCWEPKVEKSVMPIVGGPIAAGRY